MIQILSILSNLHTIKIDSMATYNFSPINQPQFFDEMTFEEQRRSGVC